MTRVGLECSRSGGKRWQGWWSLEVTVVVVGDGGGGDQRWPPKMAMVMVAGVGEGGGGRSPVVTNGEDGGRMFICP